MQLIINVSSLAKKGGRMKYIIISFAILFSVALYWLQLYNTENTQYTKIQRHGKVQGLEGIIVLNLADNHLTLTPYDRFTFQIHTESTENLTMQVIDQPQDQDCEITKSIATLNRINLNILCKKIIQSASGEAVASL